MLKLRRLSLAYSTVLLITLGANGIFALLVMRAHDAASTAQSHRQEAITLILELQREVGQLARFVRAFTTTGELRYLNFYYDILAIRDGEKAMPANYNSGSYWDEVVAGRLRHSIPVDGPRQSLSKRMSELGFDQGEFVALRQVLDATEAVKAEEQVAFAATQGLYDPVSRTFVSEGQPHLEFASRLVHSPDYNRKQADLSRAVEELLRATDRRTGEASLEANRHLERWITISAVGALVSIMVVIIGFIEITQKLLVPIQSLRTAASRPAKGR